MPSNPLPLAGRVAVVTGASRGIGRAAALALGEAGAHVVAVARTKAGLEELDDQLRAAGHERATLVPMDLCDAKAPDVLGAALFERFGKLDILIAAAGALGVITPLGHMDIKTWDMVVGVNLTANWRLIRAFDPLFRRAEAARLIVLTSSLAAKPRAFWGAYAASKAGLEAMMAVYADETETTTIRTCLLDPGPLRTKMRAAAFPGEDPDSLDDPAVLGPLIVELSKPDRKPPPRVRFRDTLQSEG